MIVVALLGIVSAIAAGLFTLIPSSWTPPSWLTDQSSAFGTLLAGAGKLSGWVPVQLAVTVVLAVLASFLIGVVIRITRMIISNLTGGGGAT